MIGGDAVHAALRSREAAKDIASPDYNPDFDTHESYLMDVMTYLLDSFRLNPERPGAHERFTRYLEKHSLDTRRVVL
jgi:hypothetical protein